MPRAGPEPHPHYGMERNQPAEWQRMRHKGRSGSRCIKPSAGTWHSRPGQLGVMTIHPAFSLEFHLQNLFLLSMLTLPPFSIPENYSVVDVCNAPRCCIFF